ncbi:hypothetical protein, partial [Aquabacterium sp.]|uniref:hypothetical protein n=1 Tax=Aquabacterium sp. TaxID=1872578 RepID=UPI00378470ED
PMPHQVADLRELRRHLRPEELPPWRAALVQRELNGGKASIDELARLADRPEVTTLTVSGLEPKTLEFLCSRFGQQLTAIHFWKCPRLPDLSPLEQMPRLTQLAFYWNQKATRLWDFRKTPALRGLQFDDFGKLERLDDLARAASLDTLVFGNAVWNKFSCASLEPLAGLRGLKVLAFNAKAIGDGRLAPLAALTGLAELDFPSNLFRTEQLAWLRAQLPATVSTSVLQAWRPLRQPLTLRGRSLDVLLCGKGKPFLSSTADAARIARHVAEFDALVQRYAGSGEPEPV